MSRQKLSTLYPVFSISLILAFLLPILYAGYRIIESYVANELFRKQVDSFTFSTILLPTSSDNIKLNYKYQNNHIPGCQRVGAVFKCSLLYMGSSLQFTVNIFTLSREKKDYDIYLRILTQRPPTLPSQGLGREIIQSEFELRRSLFPDPEGLHQFLTSRNRTLYLISESSEHLFFVVVLRDDAELRFKSSFSDLPNALQFSSNLVFEN